MTPHTIHHYTASLIAAATLSLTGARAQAAPGDLDTTFGGTGAVTTAIGTTAFAAGVALQSDGKILVAAGSSNASGADFAVARYTTTGSLDTSFGGTGKVIVDFAARGDYGGSIAIQADGKIVLGGSVSTSLSPRPGIARLNPNGSLDTIFGGTGKVIGEVGSGIESVAVQSDGKIVATGGASGSLLLMRVNPNGSLDTTFGGTGSVITPGGHGSGVAVQSDGKIIVASQTGFTVARYLSNGTLDTTFGGTGTVTSIAARGVVLQGDGKIVVAGGEPVSAFAAARYNTNGTLDTSFGGSGVVTTSFTLPATGNSVALQSDGRIVVAGVLGDGAITSNGNYALVRYNSNGSLDTSFGSAGRLVTDVTGFSDSAEGVKVQSDGKIVAAGTSYVSAQPGAASQLSVVRYLGGSGAPQPDLQVTNIVVTKDASVRKLATITATIANPGTAPANASQATFKVGTTTIGTVVTPAIAAGWQVNVSISWNQKGLKRGTHVLSVTADATNVVPESNEANNTRQATAIIP